MRLANWNPPLSYGRLSLADEPLFQIALRAAYLEKQNTHLKITLNTLNVENAGIKVTRFSVLCIPYCFILGRDVWFVNSNETPINYVSNWLCATKFGADT